MNIKTPLLMGLMAVAIMSGGFFAFDNITAKELTENKTVIVPFSTAPVEYTTYVKPGESIPIDFKVFSSEDVDLKVKIIQIDSRGNQLTASAATSTNDLSVSIADELVSFKGVASTTSQTISGTVDTSTSLKPGVYHMAIDVFDKSTGLGWNSGFQIIIEE